MIIFSKFCHDSNPKTKVINKEKKEYLPISASWIYSVVTEWRNKQTLWKKKPLLFASHRFLYNIHCKWRIMLRGEIWTNLWWFQTTSKYYENKLWLEHYKIGLTMIVFFNYASKILICYVVFFFKFYFVYLFIQQVLISYPFYTF